MNVDEYRVDENGDWGAEVIEEGAETLGEKAYSPFAKAKSNHWCAAGPYTGFNDEGGKAQFSTTGGGQGPQISKCPQNHKGPPLCENRDLRFWGGGMAPLPPPLYTGLMCWHES